METNEFSFILKPAQHGIGVFATHAIKEGTFLRLFGDEEEYENRIRMLPKDAVPTLFRNYTMSRAANLVCPEDFGQMPVGWYLNHSKDANAVHKRYNWYASRDIASGEEICIDYATLEEPEEDRDAYYNTN